MRHQPFADRRDAGLRLAERLSGIGVEGLVVIGLARGGVVVASEVARALGAPLDVICVRKITAPDMPELAVGAVDEEGGVRLNQALVEEAGMSDEQMRDLVRKETEVASAQASRYRAVHRPVPLDGRSGVVVEDGVTTGLSALAAAGLVRGRGASQIDLAVPVSPGEALEAVRREFHHVVCVETPPLLLSLDEWYQDFPELTDEDVKGLLTQTVGFAQ